MDRPKLELIKGGLPSKPSESRKRFVSAYITDTRLMGVLVVYVRWDLVDYPDECPFHQFFYIDCEEAGLETYESIIGDDPLAVSLMEQALIGGLGSRKIDVSRKEVFSVLSYYRIFNEEHGQPLPDKLEEYGFLTTKPDLLDPQERAYLISDLCGDIVSDYQVANYFVMRVLGHDDAGASYLATDKVVTDFYKDWGRVTLLRNSVDARSFYPDGAFSYICESLIEMNGTYYTTLTRVVIKDLLVVYAERKGFFRLSVQEATLMLARPEFVTVYEVLLSEGDMNRNIGELTLNLDSVVSRYRNGQLFMSYRKNNSHVDMQTYYLNNDVEGVYFLTDYGQLICSAFSLDDIQFLEERLAKGPLAPYLEVTSRYQFHTPVLMEFINGDFDDFDDFVDGFPDPDE